MPTQPQPQPPKPPVYNPSTAQLATPVIPANVPVIYGSPQGRLAADEGAIVFAVEDNARNLWVKHSGSRSLYGWRRIAMVVEAPTVTS